MEAIMRTYESYSGYPALLRDGSRQSHCELCADLCLRARRVNGSTAHAIRLYEMDTGIRFTPSELNAIKRLITTMEAL